jgi:hypothetical protein
MAGKDAPKIFSYESTEYYLNRIATITRETTYFKDMDKEGGILKLMKFLNLFK